MSTKIAEALGILRPQIQTIERTLETGEVSGDARTLLRFERTHLQGAVDLALYLTDSKATLADLTARILLERMRNLTGESETGVLHIHPVSLVEHKRHPDDLALEEHARRNRAEHLDGDEGDV